MPRASTYLNPALVSCITFIYVASDEVDSVKVNQEKRLSTGSTVADTRDNHKFLPVNKNQVCVSRISKDNTSFYCKR